VSSPAPIDQVRLCRPATTAVGNVINNKGRRSK
jgi:hypothetical protein